MSTFEAREIGREAYAAFLAAHRHAPFQRLAWLDAVAEAYPLRLRLVGYFRAAELIAVTPLMGRRFGPIAVWGAPLRKCSTPPATLMCAPPECAAEALPALNRWLAAERIGYAQATVGDDVGVPARARSEPLDNLELDLARPLEELWASLSTLPRRAVRKAVRAGVRIHWRADAGLIDEQRALLAATYGRQGVKPNHPPRLYAALLERRRELGLRVLCASHGGRTVAAVWTLDDGDTVYYWDAAARSEARRLNANHLLVWCLIRHTHRHARRRLDFVGTATGGSGGSRPGIGRFKRSWGARAQGYRIVYFQTPAMRWLFRGYRAATTARAGLRRWRAGRNVDAD